MIVPHLCEREESATEIINTISKDKLLLLDKKIPGVTGSYAGLGEFEKDKKSILPDILSVPSHS